MQKSKLTKLLCLVLSLMMILGAAPITVFAADSDFVYDGYGELTAYNGAGGDISIPGEVLTISSDVFKGCTTITSVSMPSVYTICEGAFSGCVNLESITVGNLFSVESDAFEGCTSLKNIICSCECYLSEFDIECLFGIGYNYIKLEHNFVDDWCTNCGWYAFDIDEDGWLYSYFGSDADVVLPDRVSLVYRWAFESKSNIKSVYMPSVCSIKEEAFTDCDNLESIAVSDELSSVDDGWYVNCPNFKTIYYTCNSDVDVIKELLGDGFTYTRLGHTVADGVCTLCGAEYEYTAEDNVLTATLEDLTYTLTLTENGTFSEENISVWQAAGLTLPDIVYDIEANTASITAGDATATVTLAEGALQTHSVKVICGTDANGKSYIADVMPGTAITVTAGTYENKEFEKWNAALSVNGSADETVTFNMPNEDVTVEAQFVDCYPLSVFDGSTLTSAPQMVGYKATVEVPTAPEGMRFKEWTAEGVTLIKATADPLTFEMPANAVMLTANYVSPCTVTVEGGTITGAGSSAIVFPGDVVSVTADEDTEDAPFKEWSSDAGVIFAEKKNKTTTFYMPESDVTVTALKKQGHTVTVIGGKVTEGLNSDNKAFSGQSITISAVDTDDYRFLSWICDSDITISSKTSRTTVFVMPDADITISTEKEQSYSVAVTGGTASGVNPSGKAFAGDTITVTVNNVSGHIFTGWTGEGVELANAANATTTFTMPAGNVAVTANYEQIKAAIPTAGTNTYTYNGTEQTYVFANEGDKSYYTLTNNIQTDAGTYTVKAHLVDGVVWTDDTTADKEFTFVIARQPVDKPTPHDRGYYYDGTEQRFIFSKLVGGYNRYYETTIPMGSVTIENNTRTNAGTQTVTATPTANYCWSDGTTDTLSFTFTVERLPLMPLFEDTRSFTYNGNMQTYTPYMGLGGGLYDLDGYYYNLTNRRQTKTGDYTVTATPAENYCWFDGSTAPKDFSFNIQPKKLNSYIYYIRDLDSGNLTCDVDISYTEFDNISALKDFKNHPKFKPDMLKDHYTPYLLDVPDDAKVEFYITEKRAVPGNQAELDTCLFWDDVKMSDLKPNTLYYVFAIIDCDEFRFSQFTEITDCSCFKTTSRDYKLITVHRVTSSEINPSYGEGIISSFMDGGLQNIIGAFCSRKIEKTVNVDVKVEYFFDLYDAIVQATKDIDAGLFYTAISWEIDGHSYFKDATKSTVSNFRKYINTKSAVRLTSNNSFASTAGYPDDPTVIPDVSDEPPMLTLELLYSMLDTEQIEFRLLDNAEFKVEMDLDLAIKETEAKNEALLERFESDGLIPEEGIPDDYFSTVTVNNLLYDPETGLVEGESNGYELAAGELLPAEAIKEVAGYTFDGLYYMDIFDFELEEKSAEATGDHGMILTQGLVKWDPETDYATRDLDLMAIYVKDGTEEPVGYKADGTTFLDEGSEVTVTLPSLPDGMTYGDVINNNADINVSAITDGKVTVTLANDVTGEEPFIFTVEVNANIEGIEDPFYYILVTLNAVDETAIKEEAKTAIEALAGDDASDEVKSIIADAVAALADANSIEAVNEIFAKAEAAVALQKAKEDSKTAIEALAGDDASDEVKAIVEKALTDVKAAEDIAAVEAIVAAAETDVAEQKAVEALAEAKEEAKAAIDAAIEADDSDDVKAAAEEAKAAIDAVTTIEEVEAAKTVGLEKMEDARGRCPYCGEKGHNSFITKVLCLIKRVVNFVFSFFESLDMLKDKIA